MLIPFIVSFIAGLSRRNLSFLINIRLSLFSQTTDGDNAVAYGFFGGILMEFMCYFKDKLKVYAAFSLCFS